MPGKKIKEARKSGFSVVINITGFASPGEKFEPEKQGENILLRKLALGKPERIEPKDVLSRNVITKPPDDKPLLVTQEDANRPINLSE